MKMSPFLPDLQTLVHAKTYHFKAHFNNIIHILLLDFSLHTKKTVYLKQRHFGMDLYLAMDQNSIFEMDLIRRNLILPTFKSFCF